MIKQTHFWNTISKTQIAMIEETQPPVMWLHVPHKQQEEDFCEGEFTLTQITGTPAVWLDRLSLYL